MSKIILDTNVPVKASVSPAVCPPDELEMQKACMEYMGKLIQTRNTRLVLDLDYEILKEYRNNVCKNSPMGMLFLTWLNNYLGTILSEDFIKLEKNESGQYIDYPYDEDTKDFDESDKKFVALANVHAEKPPIIEAADGKWLGYENAFAKYGIHIEFLDRNYAQRMYEQKILNKGSR